VHIAIEEKMSPPGDGRHSRFVRCFRVFPVKNRLFTSSDDFAMLLLIVRYSPTVSRTDRASAIDPRQTLIIAIPVVMQATSLQGDLDGAKDDSPADGDDSGMLSSVGAGTGPDSLQMKSWGGTLSKYWK